jgi:hypothetical protein
MKKVVWICLGNGFAWIWCSYVLAYLGREQIAETLSSVAVKEIIGWCRHEINDSIQKFLNTFVSICRTAAL